MAYISPSKEALLASISSDMKLTKGFFQKTYGYSVTDASFPDKAIAALEAAGCSKARQYYIDWVTSYEAAYEAEMRKVAVWYKKECEKKYKGGERQREQNLQTEAELLMRKKQLLMQKSQKLTAS